MKEWYAAYTQANSESRASRHLVEQGFEVYLPVYRKSRRHARRVDVVSAPLFSGYVFIGMDIERIPWRVIDSTVGVRYLVRNGERPAIVPPGIIESLRAREDEHGHVKFAEIETLSPGEQVRVVGGPFDNLVGTFERMTDRERVVILLELLGRPVQTVLPREALRRYQ
jgi:transcriptional antiterminator RfaH